MEERGDRPSVQTVNSFGRWEAQYHRGRVCAMPGWAYSHLMNAQSNTSPLEHDRVLPNPVVSPSSVWTGFVHKDD